jgi:hypothetical protein
MILHSAFCVVDVVLTSLAGDFIAKSFSVLAALP